LVAGDFDNDGKIDFMAQGTVASNSMNLYPNINSTSGSTITSSTFNTAVSITLDANTVTTSLQPYDFNCDGKLDVLQGRTNGFTILENSSTGIGSFGFNKLTFTPGSTFASQRCVAADLDLDGLTDIICINMTGTTLSIFRNTSSGGTTSFNTTPTNLTLPYSCGDIITADLDNDGDAEIIVSTNGKFGAGNNDEIHFFENTNSTPGVLSMSSSASIYTTIPAGMYSSFSVMLAATDLDNDNDVDIVAISKGGTGSSLAWVMRNDGSLSFTTFNVGSYYYSYALVYTMRLGDVNGDGKTDIIFHEGNSSGKILAILNKYSSGTLSSSDFSNYSTISSSYYIPVGFVLDDFNQDGKIDIISNQYYNNNLSYLTNGNSVYFAKSSAPNSLYLTSSWSTNFDGTGSNPSNFTIGTFVLDNSSATTHFETGSNWNFGANLSVPSGKNLVITASTTHTISGNLANSGYIFGDASSTLVLSGSADNSGDANLYNLQVKTGSSSVVFSANDSIRNTLTIESGASINITNCKLYLYGSISNSGSLIGGSGSELYLYGTSAQAIGTCANLDKLILNNNSGASIGSHLSITGSIELSNGVLSIGNYNLTMNGVLVNSGTTAYVKTDGTGKFISTIDNGNSFYFPVGNSAFNPVNVTNNSGASDVFSVKVLDEVYNNGVGGNVNSMLRIKRTWDIHKNAANNGSGVDFTFYWNAGEESGSILTPILNHFNGTLWEIPVVSSTSASANSLTIVGYTGTFSPFAIGNGFTPLPVKIIDIKANGNLANANDIKWITGDEHQGLTYQLLYSHDGIEWSPIASFNASSNAISNYAYVHQNPSVKSYYQIRIVESEKVVASSRIVLVDKSTNTDVTSMPYPNPSSGSFSFTANDASEYEITDVNGKLIQSGTCSEITNINDLSQGIYFVKVTSTLDSKVYKVLVK